MAYNKNEYNKEYNKKTGYAAQKKYQLKTRNFSLQLNRENDSLIIQKLESVPNKVDYLRNLIKKDIEENGI